MADGIDSPPGIPVKTPRKKEHWSVRSALARAHARACA
jgi:hypothetical protein